MTRRKAKDWERVFAIFLQEFQDGCETLRNQKNFIHSHRSVLQFIDWFDEQWNRMLDERYHEIRKEKKA